MIISNINSGLGNQMFQYAAGLALANRHGVPQRLDTRFYQHQSFRTYQLSLFNISAPMISPIDRARIRFSASDKPNTLERVGQKLLGKLTVLRDPRTGIDPRVLSAPANTLLIGYWQSATYFKPVSDQLRQEFTFRIPPTQSNAAVLKQIREAEMSVSVHVRRSDYLKPTETLAVCPVSYYKDAFDWMKTRVPGASYFIFSDDPDWTRENLPVPDNSRFINHNVGKSDWEDLRLMSACKNFIIANSTFSWWGAWLSGADRSRIVAPRQWFKNMDQPEQEIVPEDWTRL